MDRRSALALLGLGALAGCGGGGSGSPTSGGSGHGTGTGSGFGNGPPPPGPVEFRDLLQAGMSPGYWIQDGVWNAAGLTRGTYTGLGGTQFETAYDRSPAPGPDGGVAWHTSWKFPTGLTEVKAFESAIFGGKPGLQNDGPTPGGCRVQLPDGAYATQRPSGATPGTFLPIAPPAAAPGVWPDILVSFDHVHNVVPSGRGQFTFDIWLQNTPAQPHAFGVPPITHEVMIPLDYWGAYGANSTRDPSWFSHTVTLGGLNWHVYLVRNFLGRGWTFIVYEPDAPLGPGTLNIGEFLRHLATRTDDNGQPWVNGTEYLASIELGAEIVDGVGDLSVSGYRIWMS